MFFPVLFQKALPRFSEYNAVADELGEAVDQQGTVDLRERNTVDYTVY